MTRFISVLLVLTTFTAWADDRPTCNPHEEDSVLLQNQKARDFFAARAADTDCVQKYQAAKSKFDEARATLVKMVADRAEATKIDAQENTVESLRQPYLDAMAQCGPCAANPIAEPWEGRDDQSNRTAIVYKSDGSCQLPTTDKAVLAKAFDNLTHDLTHLKAYPRQPGTQQGYNSIIDVTGYDVATGALDHNLDGFPAKDANLFLSVKGPLGSAFSYYFKDGYNFDTAGGLRQFTMAGTAVAPDANWPNKPPRSIAYVTASGKRKVALNTMIFPGSQTTWYVNEDGYIRYCATADFGIKSNFVQQFGRSLMLDLLNSSVEKALASKSK